MAFGFVKKTWKDRISEYPTRRTLTKEDGSTELVTVSRSEGTVSQEGDAFSADNMNDLETRVDNALNEVNSNLSELQSVDITPVSNNYAAVNTSGTYAYVKNGICYLQITINVAASYSGWANIAKLPIQLDTGGKELYFPAIDTSAQKENSVVRIVGDGKVYFIPNGTSGAALFANVSFPCK